MSDFGNIFIDVSLWAVGLGVNILQFIALLCFAYLAFNFILKLFKKEDYRDVNKQSYWKWLDICQRGKDSMMQSLWIAGTRGISTRKIGKIFGFDEVYIEEPKRDDFMDGKEGDKQYKSLMKDYREEKRLGLDHCYIIPVRTSWQVWKPKVLYFFPTKFVIDDVMIGEILVNTAGWVPVLGTWMIPSNVNRKRYTDVIKTNSIYTAYEEDWKYAGDVAQRAIEADNQYLKAKGIKESIMNVFDRKPKGGKQ